MIGNIFNALKIGKGVIDKAPQVISTIGDIKHRAEERKSGNVEKENERDFVRDSKNLDMDKAIVDQFSREFRENKNWFDSFIDGINRLPRPLFAFLAFFVLAAYDSAPFFLLASGKINYQEFLLMIQNLLKEQYWIFGIIVTFYFGARSFEKSFVAKDLETKVIEAKKEIEIEKIKTGVKGDSFLTLDVKPDAPDKVKKFFHKYKDTVIQIEKDYNLCAVGVISHAGLECGWGESILKAKDLDSHEMVSTNNVFNIKKSSSWKGEVAYREVWEDANKDGKYQKDKETEKAFFKVYPTITDSFKDYASLLTTSSRYTKMTEAANAKEYGQYLYECGYMTDGKAAEKIDIIARSWFIYET